MRKRGNTDQLRGEFAGENWGRRLSPLPARRKSLLLRATPPLRGLACWWWWREEKNKTLARSILFPLFLALHRAPVGVYTLSTVLSPIEYRSRALLLSRSHSSMARPAAKFNSWADRSSLIVLLGLLPDPLPVYSPFRRLLQPRQVLQSLSIRFTNWIFFQFQRTEPSDFATNNSTVSNWTIPHTLTMR